MKSGGKGEPGRARPFGATPTHAEVPAHRRTNVSTRVVRRSRDDGTAGRRVAPATVRDPGQGRRPARGAARRLRMGTPGATRPTRVAGGGSVGSSVRPRRPDRPTAVQRCTGPGDLAGPAAPASVFVASHRFRRPGHLAFTGAQRRGVMEAQRRRRRGGAPSPRASATPRSHRATRPTSPRRHVVRPSATARRPRAWPRGRRTRAP